MLTPLPAWAGDQRDPSERPCGRCQRARTSHGTKPYRQALGPRPRCRRSRQTPGAPNNSPLRLPTSISAGSWEWEGGGGCEGHFSFCKRMQRGERGLHSVCSDKPRPLKHRCLSLSFTSTPRAARGGTPSPATAQRSATRPGDPRLCPVKLPREPLAAHKERASQRGEYRPPPRRAALDAHTRIHTHGAAGRVTYLQVPVRGSAGRGAVLYRPYCMGG